MKSRTIMARLPFDASSGLSIDFFNGVHADASSARDEQIVLHR